MDAGADAARAQIFGDSLACEDTRPAGRGRGQRADDETRRACLRAENLLRSLAVVEDSRGEDTDEHGAGDLVLSRIEAKLDLLTALVASKIGEHFDPLRAMRWSAKGVCLEVEEAVAPGTVGAFRVLPSDWLAATLHSRILLGRTGPQAVVGAVASMPVLSLLPPS